MKYATHPPFSMYIFVIDRYLVLANMLMESEVNPFDGQEAKPYDFDIFYIILLFHHLLSAKIAIVLIWQIQE